MSAKNDGGPAFPRPVGHAEKRNRERDPFYNDSQEGMTLRDYFAAKVLAAILTGGNNNGQNLGADDFPVVADMSYKAADAMLRAREGGGR